jgi:hypothetical protein
VRAQLGDFTTVNNVGEKSRLSKEVKFFFFFRIPCHLFSGTGFQQKSEPQWVSKHLSPDLNGMSFLTRSNHPYAHVDG